MTPDQKEAQKPAFEAWCRTAKYSLQIYSDSKGTRYARQETQAAWLAWIASKADIQVTEEQIETATEAIIDCHPNDGRGYRYANWIADLDSPDINLREFASEWLAARRLEARAVLTAALNPEGK